MYADVTHSDFLKTFEDLRPLLALTGGQITLDNVGKDEYLMRTYYGNFWFGVKNNRLYVTNNRTIAEEVGRTYGVSVGRKAWAQQVKENRLEASLNMLELARYRTRLTGNTSVDGTIHLVKGQCDYFNISMTDWRHGKAELVLKDKNMNLLQWLVSVLEGF